MCYPIKCEKCGKTTWQGCGKHKEMIMSKISYDNRCSCKEEDKSDENNINILTIDKGNVEDIESSEQFFNIISNDKLTVIYFYATWCSNFISLIPKVR